MPFTPFHMGPGLFVKAALPRHFSITVFGLTQVAIDAEVLRHMLRHEFPYHTFFHSYLGATVLATILTVAGKPASQWIKGAWNVMAARNRAPHLLVRVPTSWVAALAGAFIGAYSHVLLDSLYHSDIAPLQPWSQTNRLSGVMSPESVELICVVLGIVGLAWFLERERRARKKS